MLKINLLLSLSPRRDERSRAVDTKDNWYVDLSMGTTTPVGS